MIKDGELASGVNISEAVKDNPGFAPITSLKTSYQAGGYYFANITGGFRTGGFREDYTDVIVDAMSELTYREKGTIPKIHQGIDFSGKGAMKILSLIYGKIISYGLFGEFGNTVIVGSKNGKGVYLAAHLASFNEDLLKRGEIKPNDSIGIIGKTGAGGIIHLHVGYYDYDWRNKNIIISVNGILSAGSDYNKMRATLANPFAHNEKF